MPLDVEFDWVDEAGELQHMETSLDVTKARATPRPRSCNLPLRFPAGRHRHGGQLFAEGDGAAAVVVMDRRRPRSAGSRRSSVSSVSPWGVGGPRSWA